MTWGCVLFGKQGQEPSPGTATSWAHPTVWWRAACSSTWKSFYPSSLLKQGHQSHLFRIMSWVPSEFKTSFTLSYLRQGVESSKRLLLWTQKSLGKMLRSHRQSLLFSFLLWPCCLPNLSQYNPGAGHILGLWWGNVAAPCQVNEFTSFLWDLVFFSELWGENTGRSLSPLENKHLTLMIQPQLIVYYR